jgi:hypothetical protein
LVNLTSALLLRSAAGLWAARQITARSGIGVLLKGVVRVLWVKASSDYEKNVLRYSLSLDRSEWSGLVRFSWSRGFRGLAGMTATP